MSKETNTNDERSPSEVCKDMIDGLRHTIEMLQGGYDINDYPEIGLSAIEEEIEYEYGYVSKRIQHFLNRSRNLIEYTNPDYEQHGYTLVGLKECLIQVSEILKSYEDKEINDGK